VRNEVAVIETSLRQMRYHLSAPASQSRALILSDRAYRLLLAAYPPKFRQQFGQEMAQVFRTCCRASYDSSGARGVLRLWLPTLWDWAWSAAGEWFFSLFKRPMMKDTRIWHASNSLISLLLFVSACLILTVLNPCSWMCAEPPYIGVIEESMFCMVEVDNQSGKTLRVTPILSHPNSYSAALLYHVDFPTLPAYRQRNISVESGDKVTLDYMCFSDTTAVSQVYACDQEGECYVNADCKLVHLGGVIPVSKFTFGSLESLPRPEAALEAAVDSFPVYNYTILKNVLLCALMVISLIGGVYVLVRTRANRIPTEI
jgi:hypothetical protein